MAEKNNLKPKRNATSNVDRWGHLTGHELESLEEYTRDQLRAIALKYDIKNASRMSASEVIKNIQTSSKFKKKLKRSQSAEKNNLKPKPNATSNVDRWGHLTGHELKSLEEYTRDQLRAIALKYGIKNASRMSASEVIKNIQESEEFQKGLKKEQQKEITIFEKIREKTKGQRKSLTWYISTLDSITSEIQAQASKMTIEEKIDSVDALVNQDQNVNRRRVFPGHLYFFKYKAETESLPYYDKYPLVYVFTVRNSEFYGANLHYLKYKKREIIINKLLKGEIDIPKKIIHKYLNKRCKSLFLDLAKQEWETAICLPVEDFVLMKGDGRTEYPKEYVWEEMDQYWNDRIKGIRVVKGANKKDIERVK